MATLYIPVVYIQGSDDWEEFEGHAYPEREGISLGWSDKDAALEYLISRVPDEMPDADDLDFSELGKYPSLHEGGCQHWAESDEFVAVWDAGYCTAGLWQKMETEVRNSEPDDSDDDPSSHAFDCSCFLCIPGC